MTCNDCRWKKELNACPWNYDYDDTDYAEDCVDYRSINIEGAKFNYEKMESDCRT